VELRTVSYLDSALPLARARTQKILNLPTCFYIKEFCDFLQSYKNYAQYHYALQQKENISSPLTFFCLFFDGVSYDLWYFCNNNNIMNHKRFNPKKIIPSYRPPKKWGIL